MAADGEPGAGRSAAERAAYLDATLRPGRAELVASAVDLVVPSGEARPPARLHAPQHFPETGGLLVWLHGGGVVRRRHPDA